jgi:hypothetical protein
VALSLVAGLAVAEFEIEFFDVARVVWRGWCALQHLLNIPAKGPERWGDVVAWDLVVRLSADEPFFGPWRVEPVLDVVQRLMAVDSHHPGRPPIVAVDGRSASGKTTLADQLARAVPGSSVVHTDDIAWRHAVFDWVPMLVDGVLWPLHQGRPVALRPAAWQEHHRPGAINVPHDAALVVIEGVGAGRREVAHLTDAIVWVQADLDAIEQRNAARLAAGEIDPINSVAWMAEEIPFIAEQRTWERATIIVAGASDLMHDRSHVVVADPIIQHEAGP